MRKKSPYSELFWSAFFPHFPAFGPNAEKCGKNMDQNNSEYGHFLRTECFHQISGGKGFYSKIIHKILEKLQFSCEIAHYGEV